MNWTSVVEWLVRGRGAFAAIGLHALLLACIMWFDVAAPRADQTPVLVSIVEWPEAGTPTPSDQSAPDFSPAPAENAAASDPTDTVPVPAAMEVVDNAARLADPSAPDRPADAQNAPPAAITRGPVEPREPVERQRTPRPRVQIENPYFDGAPGPAQRVARALMCARLTPSQRINCPTSAMEEATVAVIAAEARTAERLYDPVYDVFVANTALSGWRARQAAFAETGPYRIASLRPAGHGGGLHSQNPAFAANRAAADMAGHVLARPDPVWGD